METLLLIVFVIGYLAIALEHPLRIDKAASALLTAVALWSILALVGGGHAEAGAVADHDLSAPLLHHLGDIGSILFFLLGAMTIVELVDAYGGFELITRAIATRKKSNLLWMLAFITFFMSAALDNLTTAIVMAALLKKLVHKPEERLLFGGMIIIAANAGGAWSPIGDVTTIMLWIGGQVTAGNIIVKLVIPSLVSMIVPLILISLRLKGEFADAKGEAAQGGHHGTEVPQFDKVIILILGIGMLLFVPAFKSITHLPPFLGILLGVGVLWVTTSLLNRREDHRHTPTPSIGGVLQRVDTPSILFFLGILLAVAALQTAGELTNMANFLEENIGNIWGINIATGLLSSVVDNVPLVAAAIGMYPLEMYPSDHAFWELLAYCAGTGGSVLVIGSAAGVAMMGSLKIEFMWYVKQITLPALIGYFAGVGVFYLLSLL